MSLQDRDWYRKATGAQPVEFVQLPLPGVRRVTTMSTRIKRALRRAIRSAWFDVWCAVAIAAAAAVWLS